MIKLAPLNPAVPKDVADLVATAEKDIVAGKLHPFQGPLKDNTGKERVAAGKSMSDDEMQKMDFYVAGVQGSLPKK
jgi:simple sugar transport system substrate-binding protein